MEGTNRFRPLIDTQPDNRSIQDEAKPIESPPDAVAAEAEIEAADDALWIAPPFQPIPTILALILIAGGFGLYEYVLLSFWSSPAMGIHERVPYPAYVGISVAMVLCLAGVRAALGVWSPHAKLGLGILGLFACIAVGVGGGRFVSYTLRGTHNPPFTLKLKVGDRFPTYALKDQTDALHQRPEVGAYGTLMVVYRGDFDPFARYELSELAGHRTDVSRAGLEIVAVSADTADRSTMLARFLTIDFPLLSDNKESLLGPLGLIQHHRDGEPDNAIPAFFILDRDGAVRWIFTSPYYREMPSIERILGAARSAQNR